MIEIHGDQELLPIEKRDALHWALSELTVKTVEAMLKEVGVTRSMELIGPRYRYGGRAMARNFASRFGYPGTGVEALAFPPFCARILTWGGKGSLVLYERGAVIEFTECPLKHGPPEICVTSHFIAEGCAEEMNSKFELIYTHHMAQGDPSCIGILRRRDESVLDSQHLGKQIKKIENLQIDDKESDALSFNLEIHGLNILLEGFAEAITAERLVQLLTPEFAAIGLASGERIKASYHGEFPSDLDEITLRTIGEAVGRVTSFHKDGDLLEMEIAGCVYCGSSKEVCDLIEAFLSSTITALHPGCNLRFKRCDAKSSGTCRLTLTQSHRDTMPDPLQTLKMRFAKGEISEEDYRKIRGILLEK